MNKTNKLFSMLNTPYGNYFFDPGKISPKEMIELENEAFMFVLSNRYKVFQRVSSDIILSKN